MGGFHHACIKLWNEFKHSLELQTLSIWLIDDLMFVFSSGTSISRLGKLERLLPQNSIWLLVYQELSNTWQG